MISLQGKTVVVTGVTSGIGHALTTQLLAAGATVVGIARDPAKLESAAKHWGPNFVPALADLADPEARTRCIDAILARPGRIHALVNNAAECVYELPSKLPIADWLRLFQVNVFSGIELVQRLVPAMQGDGHVVNISSVTARALPNARFAPYALTKIALDEFSAALRLELDPKGIKVTVIAPGLVDTPGYDKLPAFATARSRMREQVPVWLAADDIAETVLWVLSRAAHVVIAEIAILPRGQSR